MIDKKTGQRRKRAPEIPNDWQQFILSILYVSIVPLIPLILELWFNGTISDTTLLITTAIFSVTIGASSKNSILFGIGIFCAIIFSSAFGVALKLKGSQNNIEGTSIVCVIVLIILIILNAWDRWNRHMVDQEKFWDFK